MKYELFRGITGNIIRWSDGFKRRLYYDKNKDFWRIEGENAVGKITVKLADLAFEKPPNEDFRFGGVSYDGIHLTHSRLDKSDEQYFIFMRHLGWDSCADRFIEGDLYWVYDYKRLRIYRFDSQIPWIDNPPFVSTHQVNWELKFLLVDSKLDIIVGKNIYSINLWNTYGSIDFVDGKIYHNRYNKPVEISENHYPNLNNIILFRDHVVQNFDNFNLIYFSGLIFSSFHDMPSNIVPAMPADGEIGAIDINTGEFNLILERAIDLYRLFSLNGFKYLNSIEPAKRIIFDDGLIVTDSSKYNIYVRQNTYMRFVNSRVVKGYLAAYSGAHTKPAIRASAD